MTNNWKNQVIEALLQNKVEIAHSLKESKIPTSLYRYSSIGERSLHNVEVGVQWLANPINFNDPYDSALAIISKDSLFKSALERVSISNEEFRLTKKKIKLLKQIIHEETAGLNDQIITHLKNSLRVCCFSENNKSILMWAHYAKQHTGMCVEFNFAELPKHDLRHRLLYPVSYSNLLFDGTQHFVKEERSPFVALAASLRKNSCWHYEKEWRLVVPNGIIEIESFWLMPIPKAIYLGSRVSETDSRKVIDLATKKNIPVYKMHLDAYHFKLGYSPV